MRHNLQNGKLGEACLSKVEEMFQKLEGRCVLFGGVWFVMCVISADSVYRGAFITVYESGFENPPFTLADLWDTVTSCPSGQRHLTSP